MACGRYKDALTDLAAGASPAPGLEVHLAGCAPCRQELDALRRSLALVDADLQQLLASEPSPDLQARIRQAAGALDPSPAWRPAWLWPALAGAAVLLLAVVLVTRQKPQPPAVTVAGGVPDPATVTRTPAPTRATPVEAPTPERTVVVQAAPRASRPAAPERRAVASEPEILVPPGEAEALLRYAQSVRQRTFTAESLLVADLSAPLSEPQRLEIRPLEIVPLDPEEDSGAE